ncbi:hypothetical protein G169_gp63 [Pseudomonas phage AF]|uniref:hypothetical protein n=1 Tax=Pseudomonas phage AF TaxID=1235689 RepID=UPI0002970B38|nr:hypothetical protein G169_gp63 [Pseudomonas phage AF]AFV50676.1 hypothetical protein AF_063 [Pseudomonas phage AF]
MTTDLQTLKATAQATAEKCPELLVTAPAGVMVELIKDAERYRWLISDLPDALGVNDFTCGDGLLLGDEASAKIDAAMAKEAQ